MVKNQKVRVIASDVPYTSCIGKVGAIEAIEPISDICIVRFESRDMAPFYSHELEVVEDEREPIDFSDMAHRMLTKKAMANLVADSDVLDTYMQAIQEAVEKIGDILDDSTMQGLPDCRATGIVFECRICQYQETIDIPDEATASDILEAFKMTRQACPVCDEERRQVQAKADLATYLDGLDALPPDKENEQLI